MKLVLWAACLAVVATASGLSFASAHTTSYDLATHADVMFSHSHSVSAPGDVNGDGTPDLLVQDIETRIAYVVFGDDLSGEIDPADVGDGGFEIRGSNPDHHLNAVGAGDINGDGLDDIVFGDNRLAYVVFGKTDSDAVELAEFDAGTQGNQGYLIDGTSLSAAGVGNHMASAGDQNGDGLGDLVLGASDRDAGAAYVVFGKTDAAPIDLLAFENDTQGDAGYIIHTASSRWGRSDEVAYAGDVNADGIGDTMIGVIPRTRNRGKVYVVFGKSDPEPLDVGDKDAFKGHGFAIKGPEPRSSAGSALAAAGDMNSDGKSDVLIGVPFWGAFERGSAYVVWGKEGSETVKLADLGEKGFRIKGVEDSEDGRDITADRLDFAGDVNADGRPDVVVSASASHRGRESAGSIFVVYGKKSTKTVRLAHLGRHGYRLDGIEEHGGTGTWLAGVGDVNGDGRADVMTNCGYDPFTEEGFARLKTCLVWGV